MRRRNALVRRLGWRAAVMTGNDPVAYDRWRWLTRRFRGGNVRTLDAGCGFGGFSLYAAKRGNETVGVTTDPVELKALQEQSRALGLTRVTVFEGDLRRLDGLADRLGTFDQIMAFEIIEHIMDDRKFGRDLAALLKPGGRLFLSTPYLHHRPFHMETISEVEDGGHVRPGYTHEQMRAILEDAGLEIEEQDYVSGFVAQKILNLFLRLAWARHLKVGWAAVFALRPLLVFDVWLTRLLRYPFLSIAVVARKPAEAEAAGERPLARAEGER